MQELQINYGTVKQRIYSEEEDRYILCRLHYYGIGSEDLYEKIKRDITEFPQFRFDWFFKSRTSQELHRRAQQLLALVTKEDSKEEDDFGDEIPKGRKVWKIVKVFYVEYSPCYSRYKSAPLNRWMLEQRRLKKPLAVVPSVQLSAPRRHNHPFHNSATYFSGRQHRTVSIRHSWFTRIV